ncbi:Aldehyde/histidinol dehydrogenase [Ephemerocybe angulata]|uniref:Aldehyde/histidinol dehydrogenase n=1 Tax=Ephemerocybe angulata TaxID=980116 RepID=A0A8H6LTP0_9AGAR|nr:Aldehyde/histidinol dehydrogenase [Tulosesus angulatus]
MTTPLSEIDEIHASLATKFLTSLSSSTKPSPSAPYSHLSLPYRQHQLLQLARLVQENADALCHSLWIDEGKPSQEVMMAEIGVVIRPDLDAWTVELSYHPNVPTPLRAIAAGWPVLIKPPEVVSTFWKLLAELVPKYLNPAVCHAALGGVPEVTKILEIKRAHIFYTGNARVARMGSAAAAKHLTPMRLDMGGKSPVIIDDPNLGKEKRRVSAKSVVGRKVNNSGQSPFITVQPSFLRLFAKLSHLSWLGV